MQRRFTWLFLGVSLAAVVVLIGLDLHSRRPLPGGGRDRSQLTPEAIEAEGRCASCHVRETPAIVRQHFDSAHQRAGLNCLSCHAPRAGYEEGIIEHRGFQITLDVTSGRCAECHSRQYEEFVRSRHAAPSWAAVVGRDGFTPEQYEHAHRYHPDAMDRGPNALTVLEPGAHVGAGCQACHSIGQPNLDGSVGDCSRCHARHEFSLVQARTPATCGNCHLGPDHSQIEIWTQSRHGVVYMGRRDQQLLDTEPRVLSGLDQDAPTCSTCHLSGIAGTGATHDVGDRLAYYLFAAISEARPGAQAHRDNMTRVCRSCHGPTLVSEFFTEADAVLVATNDRVAQGQAIMDGLYAEGLLTAAPFDESLEFTWFDFWHYYGRTAKHGAYMGGPDFVQWHGAYELELHLAELREEAASLRAERERAPAEPEPSEAP